MSDEPKQCCGGECLTQERVVEIAMQLIEQEVERRLNERLPRDDGK